MIATPPPESYSNFNRVPRKQTPANGSSFLKPGRALPPKVDTSAASTFLAFLLGTILTLKDRPYFPHEELTPVSASPSRNPSRLHPEARRSPSVKPIRSATAPLYRAMPSPEPLSSNLDCAFPPFPTSKPIQSRPQKSGGNGGPGKKYAEPDPIYAPISPRTASSGGLLQRMNTIAPGPFDMKKRQNIGDMTSEKRHKRQGTAGSINNSRVDLGESIRRPSTTEPGHSRTDTNSSSGSKSTVAPPKFQRKNGYGGFGPPLGEDGTERPLLSPEGRSQTFPLSKDEGQNSSSRRPSEAADGARVRQPSNESGSRTTDRSKSPARQRKPSMSGPDLTRPLPPRGASLIKPRVDLELGSSPPVPVNLAAEFGIGNPYHTPNDSSSSDASAYSEGSKASSRSSPPRSIGPGHSGRQLSDATPMNVLMADLESSMGVLGSKEATSISPPRMKQQHPRPLQPPRTLERSMLSPESPMDPAIQGGRFSPIPRNQARSLSPSRSEPQAEPIRRPTTAGRQPGRPSTSKGNCKGCSEAIKGKSVSSADGRLTGRYHKHCFVCETCQEPFQTSTFYVINDAPYCERHYHKLNGSVCQTCDKGIEGQYLESERKQKFHPGCLTCADCKRTLRNVYFEMNGQVYCERHAFQRTQQAPRFLGPGAGGSNRMERRTTRLMMM